MSEGYKEYKRLEKWCEQLKLMSKQASYTEERKGYELLRVACNVKAKAKGLMMAKSSVTLSESEKMEEMEAVQAIGFNFDEHVCWMIVPYSIIWYHCPDLYESSTNVMMMLSDSEYKDDDDTVVVPRWIFLFNCAAMLIYQTLDNMDGKQARRTGTGSALGLLFDHRCDAVNSIFGSGNWIVAMALVPGNMANVSNVDYSITKNDN
eukprot:scaffold149152_cov25-Cyclotella_meneghiniana.AAC.1